MYSGCIKTSTCFKHKTQRYLSFKNLVISIYNVNYNNLNYSNKNITNNILGKASIKLFTNTKASSPHMSKPWAKQAARAINFAVGERSINKKQSGSSYDMLSFF